MNVAIVAAAGVGSRMGQEAPKQFIHVDGKPIIVYTLEVFQSHPQIDAIEVVCLDGWQGALRAYAKQYGIGKLKWIVEGGASVQESIRNGVFNLAGELAGEDIAVIHDGVRPMLEPEVLTDVLRVASENGNAIASLPYNEQIAMVDAEDPFITRGYIPRETLRRVQTPQAYRYGALLECYKRAFAEGVGIHASSYTNTMMADLGVTLHFAAGSDRNLKLTTPENLEAFRAYLALSKGGVR